ncbi:histidine utilization repressor [Aerophototrophica crusticola]|uniref:histidine utilization repressor n=1 Tax=Aerophototrophica crusticola TaxID=1709002 RepID=UPI00384C1E29
MSAAEGVEVGAADTPRYQQVKAHVLGLVAAGALKPGDRVPSEHELVAAFGVSRMTANRALRELTAEGKLTRVAGVGTFVAAPKPRGAMLELRPIREEILARGGRHSAEVLRLAREEASGELAAAFELPPGTPLFRSEVLHREDGRPLQLEERWVLPAVAPAYLAQDYTSTTPSDYLLAVAPVQEAEHQVEAALPDARLRRLLEMGAAEPCLLLRRRTWVAAPAGPRVASLARLWYPGGRYALGGRFRPG